MRNIRRLCREDKSGQAYGSEQLLQEVIILAEESPVGSCSVVLCSGKGRTMGAPMRVMGRPRVNDAKACMCDTITESRYCSANL